MKLKLLISFIVLAIVAKAQDVHYGYDSKLITGLTGATVYVMPTGDKQFDDSLLAAVKKYWTLTPVAAMPADKVAGAFKDKTLYFIVPMGEKGMQNFFVESPFNGYIPPELSLVVREKLGKEEANDLVYTKLFLCRGGFNLNPDKDQNVIAAVMFPFLHKPMIYWSLGYMVNNLQDGVNMVTSTKEEIDMRTKNSFSDPQEDLKELYAQYAPVLKTRTLLVPELNTKRGLPEKVLAGYKYPYKILPDTVIEAMVSSAQAKDYCFIMEQMGGDFLIIDPSTKKVVYCSGHEAWDVIRDSDIKALNDAIEPKPGKKK